jgi:hypothetical protein
MNAFLSKNNYFDFFFQEEKISRDGLPVVPKHLQGQRGDENLHGSLQQV